MSCQCLHSQMTFGSKVKQIAWVQLNQYAHWMSAEHPITGIEISVNCKLDREIHCYIMHTVYSCVFCYGSIIALSEFVVLNHVLVVGLLELKQSYDCPSASEVT